MGTCQNSGTSEQSKVAEKEKNTYTLLEPPVSPNHPYSVSLKVMTWVRDSHGLFDYEAREVHQADFKVKGASHLNRKTNLVTIKREDEVTIISLLQVS